MLYPAMLCGLAGFLLFDLGVHLCYNIFVNKGYYQAKLQFESNEQFKRFQDVAKELGLVQVTGSGANETGSASRLAQLIADGELVVIWRGRGRKDI